MNRDLEANVTNTATRAEDDTKPFAGHSLSWSRHQLPLPGAVPLRSCSQPNSRGGNNRQQATATGRQGTQPASTSLNQPTQPYKWAAT